MRKPLHRPSGDKASATSIHGAHSRHHRGSRHDGLSESREYTRGRKFSSDDLQLILLALLNERACHGYELIKELEVRSDGFYSPSPGMIYPALTFLEERGDVDCEVSGNKKSYRLIPAGSQYLKAHRDRVDELLAGLQHMARKMKHLRGAIAEESGADNGVWLPVFVTARHALKRALLMKSAAEPLEQRRVAEILVRATKEINGSRTTIKK